MHEPLTGEWRSRLEQNLAAHLGMVRAPDSLWERVEAALEPRETTSVRGSAWRLAACLAVAAAAAAIWFAHRRPESPSTLEAAAMRVHQEFLGHPERLDLRTQSAAELRNWLGENSSLTAAVALARPQPDPDALELVGARWISFQGQRVAAIAYRVGVFPATLLIARARDLEPRQRESLTRKHIVVRNVEGTAWKLFSWETHGQVYALVSSLPDHSQRACVLCHVEPERRQMILRMKFSG